MMQLRTVTVKRNYPKAYMTKILSTISRPGFVLDFSREYFSIVRVHNTFHFAKTHPNGQAWTPSFLPFPAVIKVTRLGMPVGEGEKLKETRRRELMTLSACMVECVVIILSILCPRNHNVSWPKISSKKSGRTKRNKKDLGPVSRKSRKLFGPEEPFVKLRPVYSVKLVFSYGVKGIKIKITAKFRASRRLHFEDTKRIKPPEMRPKSFGTFEKRAPGLNDLENEFFLLGKASPLWGSLP